MAMVRIPELWQWPGSKNYGHGQDPRSPSAGQSDGLAGLAGGLSAGLAGCLAGLILLSLGPEDVEHVASPLVSVEGVCEEANGVLLGLGALDPVQQVHLGSAGRHQEIMKP